MIDFLLDLNFALMMVLELEAIKLACDKFWSCCCGEITLKEAI